MAKKKKKKRENKPKSQVSRDLPRIGNPKTGRTDRNAPRYRPNSRAI